MKRFVVLVGLVVILLLSACAPPNAVPAATPGSPSGPVSTPASPPATSSVSLTAAVPPSPTTMAPTPTPTAIELYPAAVQAARATAARDLQVPLASVTVVRFTPVDWRNGCLEVDRLERPCTDVIVPGYQVILDVAGQTVEYRTNLDGSQVVFAGPDVTMPMPTPDPVVFTWHREGGIAGFCDELRISATGEAIASNCQRGVSDEVGRETLLPAEAKQLQTWLASYVPINDTFKDAAVADGLTQTLAVAGQGQSDATADEKQAMLEWANTLYTRVVKNIQR